MIASGRWAPNSAFFSPAGAWLAWLQPCTRAKAGLPPPDASAREASRPRGNDGQADAGLVAAGEVEQAVELRGIGHRVVVPPPEANGAVLILGAARGPRPAATSRWSVRGRGAGSDRLSAMATLCRAPSRETGAAGEGWRAAPVGSPRPGAPATVRPPGRSRRGPAPSGARRAGAARSRGRPRRAPAPPARRSAGDRRRCCSRPG